MRADTNFSPPVAGDNALYRRVVALLRLVIEPHPSIRDAQEIRRASLLLGLLIAIIGTSFVLLTGSLLQWPESITEADYLLMWLAWAVALGIYLLARAGHTDKAALAFIVLMVITFSGYAALPGSVSDLRFLVVVPILLTATFFPVRAIIVTAAAASAYALLLALAGTNLRMRDVVEMIYLIVLTTVILVVYARHMAALEKIRRVELEHAYQTVLASEAALESRVQQRTQELEAARDEAEKARQKAEAADQMKSQFLASMSHELRTPLNSILTFSELMAMDTFGEVNEEQRDYLHKMLFSGRHLLSLINDVLDITKIQSGMMKLFLEDDFDIKKEVENVAISAEKMLQGKPIRLITQIDPDLGSMRCDKRRVRQILLNLMSNAVKFTEDGMIIFKAKALTDGVQFAVIDTGPGIPADKQAVIFEPFIQTETGVKHAGGTGLGLPISKRLAEVHGGKLWVESKPGEGAAFYVILPYIAQTETLHMAQ